MLTEDRAVGRVAIRSHALLSLGNNAAVSAVKLFSCAAQAQDISVELPFRFRLKD